jgi:uncharacterized protein (TIGR03067 family)
MSVYSLMISAAALLNAAGPPNDDAKELEKFQGTWRVTSYLEDGKKRPAEELKNSRLVFQGAQFLVKQGERIEERGTQKFVEAKGHRAVDHTITEGAEKGKTFPGIYRLQGDTLTYCFAPAGQKRPTAFTSKPGTGYYLIDYQREKP